MGQPNGIDAPAEARRDGLERRDIIGQQAASADEARDFQRVMRRLGDRDVDDRGDRARRRDVPAHLRAIRLGDFAPFNAARAQRGRELGAGLVEQRADVLLIASAAGDPRAQQRVVRSIEHDGVDKPRRERAKARIQERGRNPERDEQTDVAYLRWRRGRQGKPTHAGDGDERRRHERDERQCALQKQIGKCKRKILIQDRERQRE